MYTQKDIFRISEIVLSTKNIEKLILFGSFAAGIAKEESDIDLAVITRENVERLRKLEILNTLWSNFAKEGYKVDLILKSRENYEKEINIKGSLSYSISKKGRIIWQSNRKTN